MWGLQLRGSGVSWGDETLLQSPPPESHLGMGGGRVSAPALKQPGAHVLRHVSRNAGELSLSDQGIREEKDSKSVRRGVEGTKTSLRGLCSSAPLPKVQGCRRQDPAPGASSEPGPASSGGREGALRAIFGPNRHAPQIQAGGAGLEQREREEGTRADQVGGGGRRQPEGIKSGQEGAKTPPTTIELLPPLSWV